MAKSACFFCTSLQHSLSKGKAADCFIPQSAAFSGFGYDHQSLSQSELPESQSEPLSQS